MYAARLDAVRFCISPQGDTALSPARQRWVKGRKASKPRRGDTHPNTWAASNSRLGPNLYQHLFKCFTLEFIKLT
jgi:hypothetical protein